MPLTFEVAPTLQNDSQMGPSPLKILEFLFFTPAPFWGEGLCLGDPKTLSKNPQAHRTW